MIGKEKLLERFEGVLKDAHAAETEIVYFGTEMGVTRYANSIIHQNLFEDNCRIYFRTALGKKIGLASTNSLTPSDLKRTLTNSIEIARMQPETSSFPGLTRPSKYREINRLDQATVKFSPSARAAVVKKVITAAGKKGFTVAGALSTGAVEFAVLNSNGVRAYQPVSIANINIIVMSENSSGYAATCASKVSDLDYVRMAQVAADKCDLSRNPVSLEPGDYEVILEPSAVADLVSWLNFSGFRSRAFEEKTSFMSGRIGKKITSEQVTIYDDAFNKQTIGIPFDLEGVPKRKVVFIDKGVAVGAAVDRVTAFKKKIRSTGHASIPEYRWFGDMPWNICLSPGKAKRSTMIDRVKRGILVTRFHYIRGKDDTAEAVLYGMTRDGTFLIENGKLKCGIKNLRFTDSAIRAFRSTIAISKETEAIEPAYGGWCVVAPTMHLGSFRFTGATEF